MLILKQKIENFIFTNLEQPFNRWNISNVYNLYDRVFYKNYIYMSVVDDNSGVKPSENTGKWLLMQVDNAYAAIDLHSSTKSVVDDAKHYIEYVFSVVGFDTIALGDVLGSSIEFIEYDSSMNVIKSKQVPIGATRICANNWYNYYYCGIPDASDVGKGKPIDYLYSEISGNASQIKIIIHTNSNGDASIGSLVGGKAEYVGDTQFGITLGLVDYSKKETDDNGITSITKRNVQETMESETVIPSKQTQSVKKIIKDAMGEVVMFIANPETDSNYEFLIQLGYIDEFNILINNGVISRGILRTAEVL